MSILSWLTGGTFQSNVQDGDDLFNDKQFGEARLTYQRALKKAKEATPDEIKQIKERVKKCSYELAIAKIAEAEKHFNSDEIESAFELLDDVLDIYNNEEIAKKVLEMQERFEHQTLEKTEEQAEDMSDDDILAVISGTWTLGQAEEYAEMPETFLQGLIAAHDGNLKKAIGLIDEAIKEKPDSPYAQMAFATILMSDKQNNRALTFLNTFVEQADDSAIDEIVAAYTLIAQIHIENNDTGLAEKSLLAACTQAPLSHIPMLNLGTFLRDQKEFKRSRTALRNALDTMGKQQPDMRVPRELGLTCLAMGNRQEAKDYLVSCIDYWNSTDAHEQYDPDTAIPAAILHEEDNELEKACNIYRHLCTGYDTDHHFFYLTESARLLIKQKELPDNMTLAQEYITKAQKIASTDEQHTQLNNLTRTIKS